MKVYAIACLLALLFLFYLIISTIWMIEYGRMAKRVRIYDTIPIQKSYALNSALAAFGSLGFIIALYAAYKTLYYAHYYADSTVRILLRNFNPSLTLTTLYPSFYYLSMNQGNNITSFIRNILLFFFYFILIIIISIKIPFLSSFCFLVVLKLKAYIYIFFYS